jgi:hypothetical protein
MSTRATRRALRVAAVSAGALGTVAAAEAGVLAYRYQAGPRATRAPAATAVPVTHLNTRNGRGRGAVVSRYCTPVTSVPPIQPCLPPHLDRLLHGCGRGRAGRGACLPLPAGPRATHIAPPRPPHYRV